MAIVRAHVVTTPPPLLVLPARSTTRALRPYRTPQRSTPHNKRPLRTPRVRLPVCPLNATASVAAWRSSAREAAPRMHPRRPGHASRAHQSPFVEPGQPEHDHARRDEKAVSIWDTGTGIVGSAPRDVAYVMLVRPRKSSLHLLPLIALSLDPRASSARTTSVPALEGSAGLRAARVRSREICKCKTFPGATAASERVHADAVSAAWAGVEAPRTTSGGMQSEHPGQSRACRGQTRTRVNAGCGTICKLDDAYAGLA
ncbi:predicted protein [Postia placenta Mad-698-R]|nr:predicted protein [Postia placenta Mad-698-R]